MKTLPFISIIIPVYNVEEYISTCLESVFRQSYRGTLECILVDDCGTDKSMAVVEQLIADYTGPIECKILHHDHNRGLSTARNTGTNEAKGDYIYYLDSDDYISDDCLEKLTAPLTEYDYDMVLGNLKMFGNPRDIIFLPEEKNQLLDNKLIFHDFFVERQIYVMAWNKLVKRSFLIQNNISFLEGQLHEDELWSYKCAVCMNSLYVVKDVTYYYLIRDNSITANYRNKIEKRLSSCADTLEYVLTHPYVASKDYYDVCMAYYWGVFLRNATDDDIPFYPLYKKMRKLSTYRPILALLRGKLKPIEVKRQLNLLLPIPLGYGYIKFRYLVRKCKHLC